VTVGALQDLRVELAAALTAAGIPATLDPAAVNLPCALVDVPRLQARTTGCTRAVEVDVWLLPAAAGGADAWAWVADQALVAAQAVEARTGDPDTYERNAVRVDGYRLTAPHTIDTTGG